MKKNKKNLIFIGPLPPPIHGFSTINSKVLEILKSKYKNILILDPNPKVFLNFALFRKILKLFIFIKSIPGLLYFSFKNKKSIIYLSLSGSFGIFFDFFYTFLSSFFSRDFFFHHHSFNYLNKKKLSISFLFFLLRNKNLTHIVLCSNMSEHLIKLYNVKKHNVLIQSNSFFLNKLSKFSLKKNIKNIGYFGSIEKNKGILDFILCSRYFVNSDIDYNFFVAGNLYKNYYLKLLSHEKNIKYLGPVYGLKKDNFFKMIDVLIYPTLNDAEPLVILEALSYNIIVISRDIGCINNIIDNDCGFLINSDLNFADESIKILKSIQNNHKVINKLSLNSNIKFKKLSSNDIISRWL